ncbi:NAD(P)-dependent alcohol dehydrogenase [Actinophytocola gossypii]|uniref:NAD(P)-dependent alcohol dehydrogenase n=1 Tax=Actinophytocola gossypii TaxID=2812003 RepID=A0ABT2JBE7_9PSEU|nr:NAD(P)-dependent alcohol dehydrogenase [Actinophytocola gossypii]MCT2585091.1 NAD(P)-dependent alcohol dehydrogenase [Actinophytocola gossypii]
MKAITQDSYGQADVLALTDVEQPVAGEGEVLVRVRAAGLDYGVWHFMAGLPYPVRAVTGLRTPRDGFRIRGRDVAGVVDAIGSGVTGFRPGDEVFGICEGSFAEFARVPVRRCLPKPARLSFEQAAALPISGLTALTATENVVRPGDDVLVIGAAGGVGTFAVQLAKTFGGTVTGVCSTAKVDLAGSVGATRVIDHTREDFADGTRYDVIIDTAGRRPLRHLRRALAPKGTLVIIGGEGGGRWLGGLERNLAARLLSPFVRQRLTAPISRERKDALERLVNLVEAGHIAPVVGRTYPLADAPQAIRDLVDGRIPGKAVITV